MKILKFLSKTLYFLMYYHYNKYEKLNLPSKFLISHTNYLESLIGLFPISLYCMGID